MFNWSLENREKITQMVQEESASNDIIHKILSWGVPVESIQHSNYETSNMFQFSNNFFVVLIKYKGNLRHEIISSGNNSDEEVTESVLEKFRKNYQRKINDIISFVDNARKGFSPIRPLEEDLDIIQYITEFVTSDELYDKIFWMESIYSSKLFRNFIFIFKKDQYEIPLSWYELLFFQLPLWEEYMTEDVYNEYLKLQDKYQNITFKREDLQNCYTSKG